MDMLAMWKKHQREQEEKGLRDILSDESSVPFFWKIAACFLFVLCRTNWVRVLVIGFTCWGFWVLLAI